jgi:hypothetical protein
MVSTKIFCQGISIFIILYFITCDHIYMFMNNENVKNNLKAKNVSEEEI